MNRNEFRALTQDIVLLDGATGSNLMAAGMPRGVCTEAWILENPQPLVELQKAYAKAGSQIVYAPTFTANAHYLAMHGLENRLEQINGDLVALSRKAVGESVLVAGDMTTLGKRDLADDALFEIYAQQAKALLRAGVDLFAVETMLGCTETVIALEAIRSLCDLPVLCTLTVEADGRTYFGDDSVEACVTLEVMGADAVGINCSCGPEGIVSTVRNLAQNVSIPIVAKPNAGMPEIGADGVAHYPMSAESFANAMQAVMEAGATILGGCCGTTPAHLAALRYVTKR